MRRIRQWLGTRTVGARRGAWIALTVAIALASPIAISGSRGERGTMDPRAAEREELRYIAARASAYAALFHRPAFNLDSVSAHLDSANAATFNTLRVDRWGDPVGYNWDQHGFRLFSPAGRRVHGVHVRFTLPPAAQGHLDAWGMYVPDHPVIISLARGSSTPAHP